MKKLLLCLSFTGFISLTSFSHAAIVNMSTYGTISSIGGDAFSQDIIGGSIFVQFSYDTSTPCSLCGSSSEYLNSNPLSISFSTSNTVFSSVTLLNTIEVENDIYVGTNSYYDSFSLGGEYTGNDQLDGRTPSYVGLSFWDNQNCWIDTCRPDNKVPMLDSSNLPEQMINYESARIAVRFAGDTRLHYISFNASPVPVPAAVWLFGSGLIGLLGFARRKNS